MVASRHVMITGGSSGIGKAIAKRYAAHGDDLTIVARRPEVLHTARQEIDRARGAAGGQTRTRSADVTDRDALNEAFGAAMAEAGVPAILIASAGIVVPGYFSDLPTTVFEEHMAVNYFGTLYAIRAVLPAMRAKGRGRVVLVSSGAGLIGILGYTAYCPTKYALKGLAESLRAELERDGIGISVVYPPDTETPMLAKENRIKPPETRLITQTAKTWSADDVARVMDDGIAKGRFVITPGWEMTWLARLNSLIRPLIDRHFDSLAEKARRDGAVGR